MNNTEPQLSRILILRSWFREIETGFIFAFHDDPKTPEIEQTISSELQRIFPSAIIKTTKVQDGTQVTVLCSADVKENIHAQLLATDAMRDAWHSERTPKSSSTEIQTLRPWADSADSGEMIHCTHHKAGTVWYAAVLNAVAVAFGLRYDDTYNRSEPARFDFFLSQHSEVDPEMFPQGRCSHMVRDPRDMIVSGYYYHHRSTEAWLNKPEPWLGGRGYKEHLNKHSLHNGLLAEIRFFTNSTGAEMKRWNYHNPAVLELRYEQAISHPEEYFYKLFRHYGFIHSAAVVAANIGIRNSLDVTSGRLRSGQGLQGHIRSGKPGNWRDVLTPAHQDFIKHQFGDLIVSLGYETSNDW